MRVRRKIVFVSLLALLVVLAACRGEQPTPDDGTIPAAATKPLPTPSVPPATLPSSPADPSPLPTGVAKATVEPVGTATQAGPNQHSQAPRSFPVRFVETAAPPTPAPPTATPAPPEPASHEETLTNIRQMVKAYWEAFNDYEADRALPMLEDGYRELEEDLIRRDIGRMKLFRIKLDVSEETPPVPNADGDYETWISMKTPVDTRSVKMIFRRIDGQWRIVFSDEVE